MAQGYDRTSIEDVARGAGVSRPIVYAHHGSKEGLYVACVRRARARYVEQLSDALASSPDPRRQLATAGELFFSILEQNPKRWLVLFGGSAVPVFGELGDQLMALRAEGIARIATVLDDEAVTHDPTRADILAHAIAGTGEQVGRWWIEHPEVPRSQIVEIYTDFIWSGLRSLAAPASGDRGAVGGSCPPVPRAV